MLDEVSALLLKSKSANEALDYVLTNIMEEHGFKIGVVVQFKNEKGKISHYINHGFSNRLLSAIEALTIDDITMLSGEIRKNIFLHQTPHPMNRRLIELYYLLEENGLNFGMTFLFRTYGETWGALHFWHTESFHFSDDEISQYDLLNRIIGLGLENQRLKANSDSAAAVPSHEIDLFSVFPILGEGSQSNDLNDILDDALNKTLMSLNLKSGIIYLIDEHEKYAELVTYTGVPADYIKHMEYLSLNNPSVASIIHAGQNLVTVELAFKNPEMYQLQHQFGIKRIVSIPLRARNQILGFVNLAVPPFRNFSNHEIYFLDSLSKQLGLLVENTRLAQRCRYYATENMALPA
jgi:GAF domain-containing protein